MRIVSEARVRPGDVPHVTPGHGRRDLDRHLRGAVEALRGRDVARRDLLVALAADDHHLVAGARVDAGEVEARVLERDREHLGRVARRPAPRPVEMPSSPSDAPIGITPSRTSRPVGIGDWAGKSSRRTSRTWLRRVESFTSAGRRPRSRPAIRRIRRIEPEQERPDVDPVEGHPVGSRIAPLETAIRSGTSIAGGRQLVQHAGEPLELPLDVAADVVGRARRDVEVGVDAGELERRWSATARTSASGARRLDAQPRQADVDLDQRADRAAPAPANAAHVGGVDDRDRDVVLGDRATTLGIGPQPGVEQDRRRDARPRAARPHARGGRPRSRRRRRRARSRRRAAGRTRRRSP